MLLKGIRPCTINIVPIFISYKKHMTIASEISRLQTAKDCLRASIESKGVSVPSNLTLEDYYCCVDAIREAPPIKY